MILILRALHVNPDRTKVILKPDKTTASWLPAGAQGIMSSLGSGAVATILSGCSAAGTFEASEPELRSLSHTTCGRASRTTSGSMLRFS